MPKLCTLSIPNVKMGLVNAATIEKGQAPEINTPVTIANCPAGVPIKLKWTDANNVANSGSNILSLKPYPDRASGVGIALEYSGGGGLPQLRLGEAQQVIDSAVEDMQAPITFKVRYVKNGSGPVTAGKADANAEVTLTYQ